ncbi:hypothetical protein MED92_13251 [Oceanospirillum sp. MED92]|uniref:WGR domain-containing protein n=2 Tax=Neptuniibacter caesariensis TaxID=207954 RepID=A0A7U8C4W5_NEPCE|nr:hypothetical protein MED92_13251 [Oceanospirillum sp. MED92] [Neptuniibacter caesariensis]
MYQDLVGDWIVSQSWGNCSEQSNSCSHTVTTSYQEARLIVREIRLRLKKEGFRHVPRKETQLGFEFELCHLPEQGTLIPAPANSL